MTLCATVEKIADVHNLRSILGEGYSFSVLEVLSAGARSKNSATNHSTFQKKSELFNIGGGHVVPVVNNTTCFSKYKWLLFLLLFSSYFPLLSHSFLK